jgi:hypothetical protein
LLLAAQRYVRGRRIMPPSAKAQSGRINSTVIAPPLEDFAGVPGDYPPLENEPKFQAEVHLQLEPPSQTLTLESFGYHPGELGDVPSTLAVAGPFRLLSDEGVQALRFIAAQFKNLSLRLEGDSKAAYLKPRGIWYSSQFVRELCTSPLIRAFFSDLAGTPLAAHGMPTVAAAMIYAPPEIEKTNQGWHLDTVNFATVIALTEPDELDGGCFQYFRGTRAEVAAQLNIEEHELRTSVGRLTDLEPARVVTVKYPAAGYALFMQGNLVLHRGEPLRAPAERVVFVPAFVPLDMRYPDVTHWSEIQRWNSPALNEEYKRHRAWRERYQAG